MKRLRLTDSHLTRAERRLIERLRQLTPGGRAAVLALVRALPLPSTFKGKQ